MSPLPVEFSLLPYLTEVAISIPYGRGSTCIASDFLENVRNSSLQILNMANCRLNSINTDALSNMPSLTTLNLANNQGLGLVNLIRSLPKISNTSLTSLVLDKITVGSQINVVSVDAFCNTLGHNLQRLSLKGNIIPSVSVDAFSCLPNLRVLDASYTALFQLSSTKQPLELFPNLEVISVSNVWYSSEQYEGKYIKCEPNQFAGCDLSTEDFFPHPPDIPQLNSPDVSGAPIYLPKDADLTLRFPPKVKYVFAMNDKAFFYRTGTDKIGYVYNNILYINGSGSLTASIMLETKNVTVAGMKELRVFDISNVGIRTLGLTCDCPNLRILYMSNNKFGENDHSISGRWFRLAPNIENLGLSNNNLNHLPQDLMEYLPKLRRLDLSYNRLTLSSLQLALDPYTHMDMEVDVSYNHMVCDCDLLNWLNTTKVTLTGVDTIICALAEKETPLAQMNRTQLCLKPNILTKMSKTVTIAVTSTAVLIIFMFIVCLTIMYKNRRGLLIRYYLWRWHRRPDVLLMDGDHMELNQESYDCFVIYDSNNDTTRPWVTIELYEQVQQWGLSLYIKDRHGIGGGTKANEIFDKMSLCQCVIIVLTEGLFEDEWVDLALHSAMAFSKTWGKKLGKRICIISYDDVDENCIPYQFHALFYPKTFLTGASVINFTLDDSDKKIKHFWRKLKTFMLKSQEPHGS